LPKPKRIENISSNISTVKNPETLLKEFLTLLDKQQQVNQAGELVMDYLYNNGKPERLLAVMGKSLLREDRNFHSIQMIEAIFKQYSLYSLTSVRDDENNSNNTTGAHLLVAAARYLAAHSPTMRSQGHTYQTANQLYHGEHLFE
jgi:hypothetical protein